MTLSTPIVNRPRPRGFSTLETVLALGIFLAVIGAVATTSVQLLGALARAEARQQATAAIELALTELSTAPFDQLASLQFVAPTPCELEGPQSRVSCLPVGQRVVRVSYDASSLTAPRVRAVDASAAPPVSGVTLVATAVLADGSTVTRSREVPLPGASTDSALLRIRALSSDPSFHVPVTVLDSTFTPVTPPLPFQDGLALARLPATACDPSGTGPCRLALSDSPEFWTAPGMVLDPEYVLGPAASFFTSPGTLTEASVLAGPPASGAVALTATSPSAPTATATDAQSLCLWAALPFSWDRPSVPLCNEQPGTVSLAGFYHPTSDPLSPFFNAFIPFTAATSLALYLDKPDGSCATPAEFPPGRAQVGWNADSTSWEPMTVCTSWTWGTPQLFGPTAALEPALFPLQAEANGSYELRFTPASPTPSAVVVPDFGGLSTSNIPAATSVDISVTFTPSSWLPPTTGLLSDSCPSAPPTPAAARSLAAFSSPSGDRWVLGVVNTGQDVYPSFSRATPTSQFSVCPSTQESLVPLPFSTNTPTTLRASHNPTTGTVEFFVDSTPLSTPVPTGNFSPTPGAGSLTLFAPPPFATAISGTAGTVSAAAFATSPSAPPLASLNLPAFSPSTASELTAGSQWALIGDTVAFFPPSPSQPATGSLAVGPWQKPRAANGCELVSCWAVGTRPEDALSPLPPFTSVAAPLTSWERTDAGLQPPPQAGVLPADPVSVGPAGAVQFTVAAIDAVPPPSPQLPAGSVGVWWDVSPLTPPPTSGRLLVHLPHLPSDLPAFAAAVAAQQPVTLPEDEPPGWVLLDFSSNNHRATAATRPLPGTVVSVVWFPEFFAVYTTPTSTDWVATLSAPTLFSGTRQPMDSAVYPVTTGAPLAGFDTWSFDPATPSCRIDMFCLSPKNATPTLAASAFPVAYRYVDAQSLAPLPLELTALDYEGDPISWGVSSPPASGAVCLPESCPLPITAPTQTTSTGIVQLVFSDDTYPQFSPFSLALTDSRSSVSVPIVAFNAAPAPVALVVGGSSATPPLVTVAQGQRVVVSGVVLGPANVPLAGVPVSSPSATTVSGLAVNPETFSSGVSSLTGEVRFQVGAAPTLPAGLYSMTLASVGSSLTLPVLVTPTASAISIATVDIPQGGTSPMQVSISDAASAPFANSRVSVDVTQGGIPTPAVRPLSPMCTTTPQGTCTVTVSVSPSAPAGVYSLVVRAGGSTVSRAFTVTPRVASVTVASNAQSDSGAFSLASSPYGEVLASQGAGAVWSLDGPTAQPATSFGTAVSFGREPLAGSGLSSSAYFSAGGLQAPTAPVSLSEPFTVELWARPESTTGTQVLLATGDQGSGASFTLSDGALSASLWSSSWATPIVAFPTSVSKNTTYHLALSVGFSPGTQELRAEFFVNGILKGSSPLPSFPATGGGVSIGGGSTRAPTPGGSLDTVDGPFAGLLDEVAFFPLASTQSAVAERVAAGRSLAVDAFVTTTQGLSSTVTLTARDGNNTPIPNTPISVSGDVPGVSVSPSTVTTDANGRAVVVVSTATDAPVGLLRGLVVTAGPVAQSLVVNVRGSAAGIEASPVSFPQGGRATLRVDAQAGGGQPLAGAVVSARLADDVSGLRVAPRSTTNDDGTALVALSAAADTPAGSYTIVVSRGAQQATVDVTVTAGVGRVLVEENSVPQGAQGPFTLRVVDASNGSLRDVAVSLSCEQCGLSFGPPTATDGTGRASFTVTDSGGPNPPGTYEAVAVVGGARYPVTVLVRATVGCLRATPTAVRASAQVSFVTIEAFDGPCDGLLAPAPADRPRPVSGVVIIPAATSDPGIVAPAVTGPSGAATVWLANTSALSELVFTTPSSPIQVTIQVSDQ